jgi:hypothetical protein
MYAARPKATIIYHSTVNLPTVRLLFGRKEIESTVRHLGIEVDVGLATAEQVDV